MERRLADGEGSFNILCIFAAAIFAEMFENFWHSGPRNLVSSTSAAKT
jgi:hypothetical protein